MADHIQKFTPDRDLQCYFYEPSAIAALSSTSATGFTVSGTWRQQFDWAVIEWNRDNTHEHPAFRYLPDGDLSGVSLTYQETRTNCIPLDSDLYATVDWPSLRVWATPEVNTTIAAAIAAGTQTVTPGSMTNIVAGGLLAIDTGASREIVTVTATSGGTFTAVFALSHAAGAAVAASETVYWVPVATHATAVAGSYQCAYADFTLSGTVAGGDYVGIAFLQEHYTYELYGIDTLATTVAAIAASINAFSSLLKATATGTTIRVYYTAGQPLGTSTAGTNGNRFGVYAYTTGAESWDAAAKTLANGTSPTQWSIALDFSTLQGTTSPDLTGALVSIPTNHVRKVRWTYAADLQAGFYDRSEFQVVVSGWTVTGTNLTYPVAGPGSRRVEDDSAEIALSGTWTSARGNYSGGSIQLTTTPGDSVTWSYQAAQTHTLYLGTRYTGAAALVSIVVDGTAVGTVDLVIGGEDVLIRWPVGTYAAGSHTIVVTHAGTSGSAFYFDFFEAAVPTTDLPVFADEPGYTLATDWDTEHSLVMAPERTAWFLDSLGFVGRANHYVGALWFYELVRTGTVYASGTVTFSGTPVASDFVTVTLGRSGTNTVLTKLLHVGDTANTLATVYALELNRGYTGVWASASGNVLTIWSRSMGLDGDAITLSGSTTSPGLTVTVSGANFTGGFDGDWRTDLTASPRLNRAVRDWSLSYFTALQGYGIDGAAAFSMELGNGDPSSSVGIAQVGPSGDPILLPTPSLQTNFSAVSLAYWQEVYAEMAAIQASAGLTPFLQFGEVQWWYFPNDGDGHPFSGMPFYDAWTQAQFLAAYGHAMATITTNTASPASYPDECAYLPASIGNFTNAIMTYVRASQPGCRFEVLYPTDVNQTVFNQTINFPTAAWTPAALAVLKTESFGFTLGRDLNQAEATIDFGVSLGFTPAQRAHLIGISDSTTAWLKEAQSAWGKGFESVVLFALDQFCLIGYEVPLPDSLRRSVRMGS